MWPQGVVTHRIGASIQMLQRRCSSTATMMALTQGYYTKYLLIFILALSFVPYRTYMMFLKVLWAIQYPCFVKLAILFNLFKEGGNFFMKNFYFFHFLKQ